MVGERLAVEQDLHLWAGLCHHRPGLTAPSSPPARPTLTCCSCSPRRWQRTLRRCRICARTEHLTYFCCKGQSHQGRVSALWGRTGPQMSKVCSSRGTTTPTRGLGVPQRKHWTRGRAHSSQMLTCRTALLLSLLELQRKEKGQPGGSCARPGAVTLLPPPWAQPGTQPRWLSSHPRGGGRPDPSTPCFPSRSGWQQGRHVAELAAELQPSIPAQLPALPLIDFAVRSRQAAAQCPALHLLTLSPPGRGDVGWGGRALQWGLRSPTAW